MDENLTLSNNQSKENETTLPNKIDNNEKSVSIHNDKPIDSKTSEGQADNKAPKEEMILGKFKTVEDLSKAYEELQKLQGKSSQEVGNLRKELADFSNLKEVSEKINSYQNSIIPVIKRDRELYNSPEYFQNNTFKEMYTEALMAYGDNLDTDRMISLLETYVKDRILAYEKNKSAQGETQNLLDSMSYSKNPKGSISNPQKPLSEMTDDEFRESIRKLI